MATLTTWVNLFYETFINRILLLSTMGRIKTQLIKRISNELVKTHREELKDSFDDNKAVVSKLTDVKSTKLRNSIAGYITRLLKGAE
jgi:small subunit ribosomal protein S17e